MCDTPWSETIYVIRKCQGKKTEKIFQEIMAEHFNFDERRGHTQANKARNLKLENQRASYTETHYSRFVKSWRLNCEIMKDEAICHMEVIFNKIYTSCLTFLIRDLKNQESSRMTGIKWQKRGAWLSGLSLWLWPTMLWDWAPCWALC